jgi:catechol-2,3-dioxygenase
MRMDGLEQVILGVEDMSASIRFYTLVLGLLASPADLDGTTLYAGKQKLVLRQNQASGPVTLTFVTQAPVPIITGHLAARGIPIVSGPVRRADGRESVVIQDPDGNCVEVISTASNA